ncbi:MAG: ornithine cyclodeaminase family protein [Myxococcales bacterium]
MDALVLGRDAVLALLPMRECVALMEEALRSLARGEALQPLRQVLRPAGSLGALASMPAVLSRPAVLGVKALSIFPGNHAAGLDSHQGAVLLFDAKDGRLLSIQDAGALTAVRTAAVSAVATRALSRQDASDLALLGAGVQAASHLEAMLLVRPIRRVRVWSRTAAHALAFAQRMSRERGLAVEASGTAREAVEGADLICTCTAATDPVLRGPWLSPGVHVNAVGSSTRAARELDASAVARARLFVDSRVSALAEAGDFLCARDEGAVDEAHIAAELGEVLLGSAEGRRSAGEITLFKSVGLGVEDVAAAFHAYERALETGAGSRLALSP